MDFGFHIFAEWGPSQHEFTTHLDPPSCFHFGKTDFQTLCTGYAMLPPPPHNKIFMMGKKYPPIFGSHFG